MLEECKELLIREGIEGIDLAAGEQGADDLEARVLCRSSYEGDDALLYGGEQ